jgi:DNA-binding NarL/FixJ family response regulator
VAACLKTLKQLMIALGRELAVYRHLNLYRFNSLAISAMKLNKKELQFLKLKALGLSIDLIAKKMGKSTKTLEDYSRKVRAKLGAETMSEAISRGVRLNLLSN